MANCFFQETKNDAAIRRMADSDSDTKKSAGALGEAEGLGLLLADCDALTLADTEELGETEADGLGDLEIDDDGETEALGEGDLEIDDDGDTDALGDGLMEADALELVLEEGDTDDDGLTEAD